MQRFSYLRAVTVAEALAAGAEPGSQYLAGGTTQLDLMKDGVLTPTRLVDLTRLPLAAIDVEDGADTAVLRVGATATMEQLAAHPSMESLPMVREALLAGASPQLRNMATIGGNLLQRTRCRYFRDPSVGACNKRIPGSGCAAVLGHARMHAILGADEHCIALHGSDLAVALTAADAELQITGAGGDRTVPLTEFYRPAVEDPADENVLVAGDLITTVTIPLPATGTDSGYLKVQERASYEFALTSAAVEMAIEAGIIRSARIALGGVGTVPWRARRAEATLIGAAVGPDAFRAAADAELVDTFTVAGTVFKVELAKRTLVRQLHTVSGFPQ